MTYEADAYGIYAEPAGLDAGYEPVLHRLAGILSKATGVDLYERHSDVWGGVYYRGEEEGEAGDDISFMLTVNFTPAEDDWLEPDYKEYAVLIKLFGESLKRVAECRQAIAEASGLGAVLLRRTKGRENQRGEVLFSLKDEPGGGSR
ncbi:hypothetical protein AAFN88_12730 [Pelagibius sp. CAU 1746]|uniref:hypothetical protein n=1 Tax=Pelagibius sp. CAU 1746 TaxID=3140370 RepID=UPI00325A6333